MVGAGSWSGVALTRPHPPWMRAEPPSSPHGQSPLQIRRSAKASTCPPTADMAISQEEVFDPSSPPASGEEAGSCGHLRPLRRCGDTMVWSQTANCLFAGWSRSLLPGDGRAGRTAPWVGVEVEWV